ncbi:hypothetical protein CWB99_03510 [Pseudoalteromonas rubra]|uniref:Uncharacterized protein n=2 Tax=Pseudoalteromonas rubra TaxID=43658 RepID=A0A5S3WR73_9GAMM|nr:hypothetical protein CWB99_03510 [Pseudoalteromonas rubra]TMP33418.1 hypothetical protein CWC00_10745 [Pseudoalteromonas rubra]
MLLGAAIAAPLTWWFTSDDPVQPATAVLANAGDTTQHAAPLRSGQAQLDSASDPASSTELIALQQQILQLQEELEQVQNHTSSKPEQSAQQQSPSSGNINRQLAEIFQAESRDPVWADELELQLGDFLYTSDLSTYFTYDSYGCKRHVCQLSFVPRSEDIDAMQWQRLNDSLFNSPWIKQFKVSSAQQTAQGMLVHFSTKSLRELATEY